MRKRIFRHKRCLRPRPTKKGTVAVLIIALMFLLMGWLEAQPAHAGISLEQQRIDRERSAQRKHELEIERIRAEAMIKAAKYQRNYY